MTRQYHNETLCTPSGHLVQHISHELCNATIRQYTKDTRCNPSGHSVQRVSQRIIRWTNDLCSPFCVFLSAFTMLENHNLYLGDFLY